MDRERVVISGVNGFVGQHLARELYGSGVSVVGIGQETEVSSSIAENVSEYYQANLIEEWPDTKRARAVIHLAGLAAVGPSFDKPQFYIDANSSMVTNLCEYYLKHDEKPRIILVSSGAIYGKDQKMPINEGGEISYSSPYAVSKVLNEAQAKYYKSRGLDCVVARPFNHIGPGQASGFILPDFYDRLSSIGTNNTIVTGNIETRRDYTDVRDIVRAYGKLALAPLLKHGVYNLCSGSSHSGKEILDELIGKMNINNVNHITDPALTRPNDAADIRGDSSRLREELGWEPTIPLHQTVSDFVDSKSL